MTTHVYGSKCPGCGHGTEVHINAPNATPESEARWREKAKHEVCSKCGVVMELNKAIEGTSDYELAYNVLREGKEGG